MTFLKATREPLSEQVFAWLLAQVQAGQWPVGSKLPAEAQLMAASGVCRSTLREAVRGLIHAGILEARQGSGTYVVSTSGTGAALKRRLDQAKAIEIMEVRQALEVQAARLAASRATDTQLDKLEALLAQVHEAAEARDLEAFIELDIRWIDTLMCVTGNSLLVDLYHDFKQAVIELMVATAAHGPFEDIQRNIHAPLMAALRAHDPAAAVAAVRAHLDRVTALLEAGGAL